MGWNATKCQSPTSDEQSTEASVFCVVDAKSDDSIISEHGRSQAPATSFSNNHAGSIAIRCFIAYHNTVLATSTAPTFPASVEFQCPISDEQLQSNTTSTASETSTTAFPEFSNPASYSQLGHSYFESLGKQYHDVESVPYCGPREHDGKHVAKSTTAGDKFPTLVRTNHS